MISGLGLADAIVTRRRTKESCMTDLRGVMVDTDSLLDMTMKGKVPGREWSCLNLDDPHLICLTGV